MNITGPIGGLNGYQRRLVYQLVRKEFPLCRVFPRKNGEFMQVEMLDPEREEKVLDFLNNKLEWHLRLADRKIQTSKF